MPPARNSLFFLSRQDVRQRSNLSRPIGRLTLGLYSQLRSLRAAGGEWYSVEVPVHRMFASRFLIMSRRSAMVGLGLLILRRNRCRPGVWVQRNGRFRTTRVRRRGST